MWLFKKKSTPKRVCPISVLIIESVSDFSDQFGNWRRIEYKNSFVMHDVLINLWNSEVDPKEGDAVTLEPFDLLNYTNIYVNGVLAFKK